MSKKDAAVAETTAPKIDFSKITTKAIEKNIADGKYEGDDLDEANQVLLLRATEKEKQPAKEKVKKAAVKKEAKPKAEKKEKAEKPVKEKKEKVKKEKAPPKNGVSSYLRKIMTPKEDTPEAKSKTSAVTYGEANALVKKKFPERKKLYPSEFDRNFEMLVKEGVLLHKQAPKFKTASQKKAEAATKEAPKAE